MTKNLQMRVFIILAVLAASLYFTFPLEKRVNLGLDLKGGMHLVLRVEMEKLAANAKSDAVTRAIEILRNRIDSMGVGETVIQRQGEDQIIVQLPGVTDREKALAMIGKVAQLEFAVVNDNPEMLKQALSGKVPEGYVLKYSKDKGTPVLLETPSAMKGDTIADARVDVNTTGFYEPHISLTFNEKGAKDFGDLTRKHVGQQLAIVLDGEVQSHPNIQEPILDGHAQITGQFTFEESSLLALTLRSGSLPAPMKIEEERTVGPLLGKDSINSGVRSVIVGGALVVGFMLIYYLLAGLISDIALVINLFMVMGTMGLLNFLIGGAAFTLTLPGIAGIILTLGMAVDANVLINERIREEVNNGRPLSTAIANGYNRAFAAIFDSHITNLIAAFLLFQFGSGPVKGFAVTMSIGIISSLFTALYVTRTIFLILLHNNMLKSLPMMRFLTNTKIDFIKMRYFCIALSLIVTIGSMAAFIHKKDAAYGIDFVGGQIQEYKFAKPVTSEQIRAILETTNVKDPVIQRFDKTPEQVMIRTAEDAYSAASNAAKDQKSENPESNYNVIAKAFKEKMPDNPAELLRIENVGPVVGKHLRTQALLAIIFAMVGILIYIAFRFKHLDFAIAGVIALIHDVLVALGLVVYFGHQVDLLVVTALLTIAGFSISDTIIIYDRVRENISKAKRYDLAEIINLSVNQTLSRTILTSLTVLLVVFSLFFLGGEVLHAFSLCLLIGFLTGTYSSVYVAAPLVLFWEKRHKQ